MKYCPGWYPQPEGPQLYWDGDKYTASWVNGAFVWLTVSTDNPLELSPVTTTPSEDVPTEV
jgi:hypothetical protein